MSGIKRDQMIVVKLEKRPVRGSPITILSISGGKDSLAMWIMMWKRKEKNLVPVYFDGGWEWSCAEQEIKRVEKITRIKCYILDHREDFDQILKKNGWPTWKIRWCSGHKRDMINRFISSVKRGHPGFEMRSAVGMAFNEKNRIKTEGMRRKRVILPLVELRIRETQSLKICARMGCDWGGHYLRHGRLSCWCCPWQTIEDLRELYGYHKKKWGLLERMDRGAPRGRKFRWGRSGLGELSKRFAKEEKRGIL